jgi:hypothetical protein
MTKLHRLPRWDILRAVIITVDNTDSPFTHPAFLRKIEHGKATHPPQFIKTSSTAAAGAALLSSSIARTAHAAGDDQIKFVVVGCGGRGTGAADQIMNTKGNVKLVAVADAFEPRTPSTIKSMSGRHKDKVDVPQDRMSSPAWTPTRRRSMSNATWS